MYDDGRDRSFGRGGPAFTIGEKSPDRQRNDKPGPG